MKIAIHPRPGSFSDRWIEYCNQKGIKVKIVNGYSSDIIDLVSDCDAFLWHYSHGKYTDMLAAKNILMALDHSGKVVYPNSNTSWHFEDKLAQKYLLESINAPIVSSYTFYDKQEAKEWAVNQEYPVVFKLKGGSGSRNVVLVENYKHCLNIIEKAFGKGFSYFNWRNAIKDDIRRFKKNKNSVDLIKAISRPFYTPKYLYRPGKEKEYVYFQEFMPNNKYDIRVVIVSDKAFALKRIVRKNDFRASGSGNIIYDKNQINIDCIKESFLVNKKLMAQSIAFDYVFNKEGRPLIVEISYGFSMSSYDKCEGYWDNTLTWHDEKINPQVWMIDAIIKSIA